MSTPPTPVTIRSTRSNAARATAGAGVATKKAMRASARNGTRSQSVKRMTKGSLRASDSVCPAANSDGRNHPSVMIGGNGADHDVGRAEMRGERRQDGRLRREGQPHEKQGKVRAERDGIVPDVAPGESGFVREEDR